MIQHYYTNERNHQIVIALLKAHGISQVVVSPGSCNSVFVGSIQTDPFFRLISAVDERSAAYIACGLALKTGDPVVINCTGATAARNYMSGATEAFYSKLPILILTSSQPNNRVGQLFSQVTDRTTPPSDTCIFSETLPIIKSTDEEWECEVKANKAILELKRHGGGPVHLNLVTSYAYSETTALTQKNLPPARVIRRYTINDSLPFMPQGRIGIFVGSHKRWSAQQIAAIEHFCETNNAAVFCDHTSNYRGNYRVPCALTINQAALNIANQPAFDVDILVHIGEVSGEEGAMRMIRGKETWRVSEDGELRDTFRNLAQVFEMTEMEFFTAYAKDGIRNTSYYQECIQTHRTYYETSEEQMVSIPFSNVWIGRQIASLIPDNSTVVLSILNSLRTWNYSEFKESVDVFSPVGGFGIDGVISLTLGASLAQPEKPCYCVVGDLAFFYDLNTLGNRHIGNNVRILLINNGCGVEFKKTYALAYRLLEEDVMPYVSAAGHFGAKSPHVVKNIAESFGFEYLAASSKEDFEDAYKQFVTPKLTEKPLLFECFVNADDDIKALNTIHNRD